MMRSTTANRIKRLIAGAGVAAFWLLVWQLAYRYVGKEILVVSPFRAARRLAELATEQLFWRSVGFTGLRVLAGFSLALLLGGVLAVLSSRLQIVYTLFRPLLDTIKATPVASIIILALIWLASGRVPVLIAFLMVLPMVWTNLYAGLHSVDKGLLEMARIFQFSRWKRVRLIYIPALMPYFTAACTTGLGAAWKSVIAAEVISHPKLSVGSRIYDAKIYLETADLFAWTMGVVLISVVLEKLVVVVLQRLNRRLLSTGKGGEVPVGE